MPMKKTFTTLFLSVMMAAPPLSEDAEQEVIYDLSGRRVLSPKKNGIYVSNGRAILVQ